MLRILAEQFMAPRASKISNLHQAPSGTKASHRRRQQWAGVRVALRSSNHRLSTISLPKWTRWGIQCLGKALRTHQQPIRSDSNQAVLAIKTLTTIADRTLIERQIRAALEGIQPKVVEACVNRWKVPTTQPISLLISRIRACRTIQIITSSWTMAKTKTLKLPILLISHRMSSNWETRSILKALGQKWCMWMFLARRLYLKNNQQSPPKKRQLQASKRRMRTPRLLSSSWLKYKLGSLQVAT